MLQWRVRAMLSAKQGEKHMPVGLFRSEDGWAQVDYGTGATIPIPRSRYEANGYKPDFDKLPSEAVARQSGWEHSDNQDGHFGGRGGMMIVAARR